MMDISAILASKEQVNIEAKLAKGGLPNSLWETYSSFANTFGGTILLGVDEDKTTKEFIPYGVSDPEQMIANIWNTLNNHQKINANILLEHHIYKVPYNDMWIIVMEVRTAVTNQSMSDKICSKVPSAGILKATTTVPTKKSRRCCVTRQIPHRTPSCLKTWNWMHSIMNPYIATVSYLTIRNQDMSDQS